MFIVVSLWEEDGGGGNGDRGHGSIVDFRLESAVIIGVYIERFCLLVLTIMVFLFPLLLYFLFFRLTNVFLI